MVTTSCSIIMPVINYPNSVVMTVSDHGRNGILFTGPSDRLFVNRGTLAGRPVEQLKQQSLLREDFKLYNYDNLDRPERMGKLDAIINHIGNFVDCIYSRKQLISNVQNQHRSVSTCHLGNISMHLGRSLQWNADKEEFISDAEANHWLKHNQRKGFEAV